MSWEQTRPFRPRQPNIAGVESTGFPQVLTDPRTNGAECLHALLVAELADLDGWNLLIELARTFGHDEIFNRFLQAFLDE